MFAFLRKLFGGAGTRADEMPPPGTLGVDELARRLGMREAELSAVPISYRQFQIPKRTGGMRTILAPDDRLKAIQRAILHRLLRRLRAHPCATGFERGHSIVTNALPHVGRDVVIKLDLKDFFTSTSAGRVEGYFRKIGWNEQAAALLTRLCTHEGALPQGAPTSPRLSNLLNFRLDARLAALALSRGASYSRYADDISLSAAHGAQRTIKRSNPKTLEKIGRPDRINDLIRMVKQIVADEGYALHVAKKLRIARRHDRQIVTGIVVNQRANLPRAVRRRLRAVEHHLRTGRAATLTPAQLDGWRSLESMVRRQRESAC